MMTGAATRERGKRLVRGAASDERSKMNSLWAQREMKRESKNILVIKFLLQSYPFVFTCFQRKRMVFFCLLQLDVVC